MANDEHVAMLKKGVAAWNEWRRKNPNVRPDLTEAKLIEARLNGANFSRAMLEVADLHCAVLEVANLSGANLAGADLSRANLAGADLSEASLTAAHLDDANLSGAILIRTNFHGANLSGASLTSAHLDDANLVQANMAGANLGEAFLWLTVFGNTTLSEVKGLDQCSHSGPSFIDFQTLQTLRNSGPLPIAFMRGVGLPDNVIDYLPSLLNTAIQHYSCFISYSSKDQAFAERLHADLQSKGVRCWFAPDRMRIGDKIIDAIDEAIRLRDKVLLILSEGAIASDWVEGEVTRALEEERERKNVVLFPVRIDDAVMQTTEGWARLLCGQRNIGDFTGWKEHDSYQKSLERLMRDLRIEKQDSSSAKTMIGP